MKKHLLFILLISTTISLMAIGTGDGSTEVSGCEEATQLYIDGNCWYFNSEGWYKFDLTELQNEEDIRVLLTNSFGIGGETYSISFYESCDATEPLFALNGEMVDESSSVDTVIPKQALDGINELYFYTTYSEGISLNIYPYIPCSRFDIPYYEWGTVKVMDASLTEFENAFYFGDIEGFYATPQRFNIKDLSSNQSVKLIVKNPSISEGEFAFISFNNDCSSQGCFVGRPGSIFAHRIESGKTHSWILDFPYLFEGEQDAYFLPWITTEDGSFISGTWSLEIINAIKTSTCADAIDFQSDVLYEQLGNTNQYYTLNGALQDDITPLATEVTITNQSENEAEWICSVGYCGVEEIIAIEQLAAGETKTIQLEIPAFDTYYPEGGGNLYANITITEDISMLFDVVDSDTTLPIEPCLNAIPISLGETVTAPAHEESWYVLDITEVHEKQQEFRWTFTNLSDLEAEMNMGMFFSCDSDEMMLEFNKSFPANRIMSLVRSYPDVTDFFPDDISSIFIRITPTEDMAIRFSLPATCEEEAIELDWCNVQLSQLSTGWYKWNVADIHSNQEDVVFNVTNDMMYPTSVTMDYYITCEDTKPMNNFGGSQTYALGTNQQIMSYQRFVELFATGTDSFGEYYESGFHNNVYIHISSIVQDYEPEPTPETHLIRYTSTDGNIVTPYNVDAFGANIISNTYENEQGLITFDGPVTTIGDNAFYNCATLSSMEFGKNLKTIGKSAFYNTGLRSAIFSEGLDSIGNTAFRACDSLRVVSIPSSVRHIYTKSDKAFQSCNAIDSIYWNAHNCPDVPFTSTNNANVRVVVFGDSITRIPNYFCQSFDKLKTVILPSNLESIGSNAFHGCDSLSSSIVLDSVQTIGSQAFGNCYCIRDVKFGRNLKVIGSYAFENTGIRSAIFHEGLDSIAKSAFSSCDSLKVVSIPSSVRYINSDDGIYNSFSQCHAIDSIYWNAHNCIAFKPFVVGYNANVRVVVFGDSITRIPNYFCQSFDKLKTVILPSNLESIGSNAFYGCEKLTSLTFPHTITDINESAFSNCSSLTTLYANPLTPPSLGSSAFANTSLNEIYVPCGSTNAYKSSAWNTYCTNFIEPEVLYTVSLHSADTTQGQVAFDQDPSCDNTAIIRAIPSSGYRFTTWNDGVTTNPRTLLLSQDTTFTANFELMLLDAEYATICYGESYIWDKNGQTYTEAGTYTTITSEGEVTLHLTILPEVPITNDSATICYGETYTWNSQTYSNEGEYSITLSNALGCDSVATLHLTIMPEATTTTETVVIGSDELPYTWRGNTYSATGQYTVVEQYTAVACDSAIHVLDLTVLTIGNHDEQSATICDTEAPYIWYGESYSATGKYTYTEKYVGTDIDSIQHILNLTVNPTVYTEETITACDSYEWNGQSYTESGDYTYTTVAANGCDSIVTLHLTINNSEIGATEYVTICYGETYTWNGQTYSTEGEYSIVLSNVNGCDSIATLHLTISPIQYADEYITACDSYDWHGQTYTQSGEYTYTTVAANGCDSIVTLHLTINQSEVGATEYATICYGETYTWNSQTYSAEGEYSITLSTANGCDSIVTLHLTILPEAIIMEESASINEEHLPYLWRGQQCYDAGKYIDSEPFTNYPYCDSVIYVLNLTVEAPNKCGDNLYWHYSNNTLSITGFGAMYDNPDLLSYRNEPWYPERVNHVVLPDAITHIGNVAFADCANLTNILIPSSVTSIGDGAFSWTGLQSVTIPASVTDLGEQVFETCNNLHTILYEGTPNSISNQTVHPFIGCVHLDTIITPAALWHCTTADPMLEARYGVPHKARYIEVTNGELTKQAMKYIAKNSGTVEVLDLSAATNTTLPLGALLNNYRLSTLYLPEQIEVIPEMLAEGCYNLLEILIPANVTEIGNYAFAGCTNVWRMTVEAVLPPKVYDKTFDGIDRSISLIVPAGSEELYRQAEYWKEFFIENTNSQSPKSNCQKILHEDHILILREGKVYTTMGQLVK